MRKANGNPAGTGKYRRLPGPTAGGYITAGVRFSSDGTAVAGGDAFGAWLLKPGDTEWTTLYEAGRLPAATLSAYRPWGNPHPNSSYVDGESNGNYAIAIAWSNSNYIYMTYDADLYVSSNKGATFTKMGGPYQAHSSGGAPMSGRAPEWKMVVDPQNPLVMMFGPQEGKIVYTTDGLTLTEMVVPAGTAIGSTPAVHYVAVDPTSPIVGGIHQGWYYTVEGTGVYQSTAGPGGPYTLMAGSPTTFNGMLFDSGGNLWVIPHGFSIVTLNKLPSGSSTWGTVAVPSSGGQSYAGLAINPSNNLQIVLADDNGTLHKSEDGGATWADWPGGPSGLVRVHRTAIGWMTDGTKANWIIPSGMEFNPLDGTLWAGGGIGTFSVSLPATPASHWVWNEHAVNQDMLIVNHIISPPGYDAHVAVWDQGIFRVTDDKRAVSPHTFIDPANGFGAAWTLDYAPSPDYGYLFGRLSNFSYGAGWSGDGGVTWNKFTGTHPFGTGLYGGKLVAASKDDLYDFPSNNVPPAESHDRGATWTWLSGMPGFENRGKATLGTGNSQLIFYSKNPWMGTATSVVVNASGTASVSVSGNTITVTPGTGADTATAVAAQINADASASALVTASAGGTGGGVVITGTANLSYESGFGFSYYYTTAQYAATDKTNGDLYLVNYGGATNPSQEGTYKRTKAGVWTKLLNTMPGGLDVSDSPALYAVHNQTGHLFFWTGHAGHALYRTTDGGVTWTAVPNTDKITAFSSGKEAPGKSYPSLYFHGNLSGVEAIWRSDDNAATWVQHGPQFPGNQIQMATVLEADKNVYGRVYLGLQGNGVLLGDYDDTVTLA